MKIQNKILISVVNIMPIFLFAIYAYASDMNLKQIKQEKTRLEEKIVLNRMDKYIKEKNNYFKKDNFISLDIKTITTNTIETKIENKSFDKYKNNTSIEEKFKKLYEIKKSNMLIRKQIFKNTTTKNNLLNSYIDKNNLNISQLERAILERIVEAEAGGEPYEGKRAVATVIINRVKSRYFPNTIKDVVFQKKQFTPITDGRYYKVKVTEETKKAVSDVIDKGYRSFDSSILFFCNPKTATSKWMINNKVYVTTIGNHSFYK